jgi:hypothetical protein
MASREAKNQYGEENEMFLKLIYTVNTTDKTQQFAWTSLFPHPNNKASLSPRKGGQWPLMLFKAETS